MPRRRRPKATFSSAVSHGYRESSPWNTTPRSREAPVTGLPNTSIRPAVGGVKPASMLSTVLLPQPDGPSRQ